MQKKIIALAIAAAISAPAFADNANVTIYGKAILDIESVSNDKSTLSRATRVQTNATRLGVKGSEDLGEGLKGWYQYEVEMDADGSGNTASTTTTTTVSGTTATSTSSTTPTPSGLGKSRNSGVGIETGFGTVMFGNWDTPFKVAHNKIELFDNTTVFSATNLIGRANGDAGKNYNTRQANVLQYWSPSLGGVKINVSYSPDEAKSTGDATTQGSNKSLVSTSATFDDHDLGIYVSVAYENRADASVAATSDTGTRLVARYTLGDFWVGAAVEAIKVNTTTAYSYTQNNSEVSAQYKLGASNLGLSYVKAGDAATTAATTANGASQISLRYGYSLSKRTELFAAYTSLKNDTNGAYGFSAGTKFGTNAGSTQSAFGTGLIVSF